MGSLIDATQFEPLMVLRENWRVIRDECAIIDRNNVHETDRVGKTHEMVARELVESGRPQWIRSWGEQMDKWLNWGFTIHDQFPLGDAGAPKTTGLLRHIRGLKVAALSLLKPGVVLPVHTHPELGQEGLLTFHLGLEVPLDLCYLSADGEFAREEDGKAVTFDGSRPHYAFNASHADRLILYCEFSPARLRWVE
jgi:aspartyl/asparaginyl beta-hydroxylase (cupin superfamily)